jgi:hypothetical protein
MLRKFSCGDFFANDFRFFFRTLSNIESFRHRRSKQSRVHSHRDDVFFPVPRLRKLSIIQRSAVFSRPPEPFSSIFPPSNGIGRRKHQFGGVLLESDQTNPIPVLICIRQKRKNGSRCIHPLPDCHGPRKSSRKSSKPDARWERTFRRRSDV